MKVSRNSPRAITMVLALTALPAFAIGGGATSTVRAADVVVRPAVTPAVFAGDVRSLPTERRWQPGDPVRVMPEGAAERRQSGPPPSVPPRADPVRQASSGVGTDNHGQLSSPIVNFDGMATGSQPMDPTGDVGPNHYVQMVNTQFQIFDKAGASLAGPTNIN